MPSIFINVACLSGMGANNTETAESPVSLRKKLRLELLGEIHPTPNAASSEIDHYLSLRIPDEYEDNPLGFWEHYQKSFPILSKLAQVYCRSGYEFIVRAGGMHVQHHRPHFKRQTILYWP